MWAYLPLQRIVEFAHSLMATASRVPSTIVQIFAVDELNGGEAMPMPTLCAGDKNYRRG